MHAFILSAQQSQMDLLQRFERISMAYIDKFLDVIAAEVGIDGPDFFVEHLDDLARIMRVKIHFGEQFLHFSGAEADLHTDARGNEPVALFDNFRRS